MNRESGGNIGREGNPQQIPEEVERRHNIWASAVEFYEQAKATGAFIYPDGSPVLDERRQKLLEAWCTTPATCEELRPLAGGVSRDRVRQLVYGAFGKVVFNLPSAMRDQYIWEEKTPWGAVRRGAIGLFHLEKPQKPGDKNPHYYRKVKQ